MRLQKRNKATSCKQQATSWQAKKGERAKARMGERKKATSCKQQATSWQAANKQHADNADFIGFSQIRKKIYGHLFKSASSAFLLYPSLRGTKQSSVSCFWIASCLAMTKPVNPDSDRKRLKDLQDKMKRINQHLEMSRRDNILVENGMFSTSHRPVRDGMWNSRHLAMSHRGLNMYNPLQAERSWGYKITTTLSELRSSSICYHSNHLNHINHSSDNKGKGNKVQTYDAFIAETRYFASHGVYCVNGIDDTYNVYDWETRCFASLQNIRQNINLQKKKTKSNEQ